jgi:hypothetical protein
MPLPLIKFAFPALSSFTNPSLHMFDSQAEGKIVLVSSIYRTEKSDQSVNWLLTSKVKKWSRMREALFSMATTLHRGVWAHEHLHAYN